MTLFPPDLLHQAQTLLTHLHSQQRTLATAESCTGGLLSAILTEISGSSAVFTHGYITYANAAKTAMLGVPPALLAEYGAVSKEVALAMAEGALRASGASISVAITGIAGPSGGGTEKPVGLVHIATASLGLPPSHQAHHFMGNRAAVRQQAVAAALALLESNA